MQFIFIRPRLNYCVFFSKFQSITLCIWSINIGLYLCITQHIFVKIVNLNLNNLIRKCVLNLSMTCPDMSIFIYQMKFNLQSPGLLYKGNKLESPCMVFAWYKLQNNGLLYKGNKM